MKLTSTAFNHNEKIPAKFTCEGENISPALEWKEVPSNSASFALILDDPDAPAGTWTHWVLFDLSETADSLPENAQDFSEATKIGLNSWNKKTYGGPCPPQGEHRYVFTLYALSKRLNLEQTDITADTLRKEMKGNIIDTAELVGLYQR